MNLPSFAEFKKNKSDYYSFATILALVYIFYLWSNDKDKEMARQDKIIIEYKTDKKELEKKVNILQEKLLIIVQKQSIKDSIR